MTTTKKSICIIAGEPSGDQQGALLVEALKKQGDFNFFGMGGDALRDAGVETIIDSHVVGSMMGITELFGGIRKIVKAFFELIQACKDRRPALIVLIDFADFNMLFARFIARTKIPVLYFITPQVWAWRKGRVKTIAKFTKKAAVIFPFEEQFFKQHGVDVEYVGHPFADRPEPIINRSEFVKNLGLDQNSKLIALLPGSRKSEVQLLLPVLLETFDQLSKERADITAVIPVAPSLNYEHLQELCSGRNNLRLCRGQARELLSIADAAVVASGTATVEALLAEVPFVIVYKLSSLTYKIGKALVTGVNNFGMANLIAGKKIVPELLQDEVTAENIVKELTPILTSAEYSSKMKADLKIASHKLKVEDGSSLTAADRVAKIALNLL
jgi:lipid-A-disaccharide synthase